MRRRKRAPQVYEVVYDRLDHPGHAQLSQEVRDALPGLRDLVPELLRGA